MPSKENKYSAKTGKPYDKDNPRPKSEAGIVVEGYYSAPGTFDRSNERRIRPYRGKKGDAKRALKRIMGGK